MIAIVTPLPRDNAGSSPLAPTVVEDQLDDRVERRLGVRHLVETTTCPSGYLPCPLDFR